MRLIQTKHYSSLPTHTQRVFQTMYDENWWDSGDTTFSYWEHISTPHILVVAHWTGETQTTTITLNLPDEPYESDSNHFYTSTTIYDYDGKWLSLSLDLTNNPTSFHNLNTTYICGMDFPKTNL